MNVHFIRKNIKKKESCYGINTITVIEELLWYENGLSPHYCKNLQFRSAITVYSLKKENFFKGTSQNIF